MASHRQLTSSPPRQFPVTKGGVLPTPSGVRLWLMSTRRSSKNTWRLVPRPPGANMVTGKWIFRHKFHSDGTLARHKAR